jgi:hypothetical protein
MGELEKTIAVVFKRGGKNVMSEREFVLAIAMNFRWADSKGGFKLDASKAQMVMDAGIARGFLTKQEGMVKPTFDYREYEVAMNYKPTEAIIAELKEGTTPSAVSSPAAPELVPASPAPTAPAVQKMPEPVPPVAPKPATTAPAVTQSLFARLVDDIAKASGLKRNDVVARINKVQEKLGTESIVAALAVARDNGIDIAKYLKEAKEEIVKS